MPSKSSADTTFSRAEWSLLVRLPGQVVVAATSAGADIPRRTVAEGLAGINAIAAGRSSDNPLVRRVVETIYAEHDDAYIVGEPTERSAGLALVLASCRRASAVLAGRALPDDRDAYRTWLESVAARACGATQSGAGGGSHLGPAERRFLADMSQALDG